MDRISNQWWYPVAEPIASSTSSPQANNIETTGELNSSFVWSGDGAIGSNPSSPSTTTSSGESWGRDSHFQESRSESSASEITRMKRRSTIGRPRARPLSFSLPTSAWKLANTSFAEPAVCEAPSLTSDANHPRRSSTNTTVIRTIPSAGATDVRSRLRRWAELQSQIERTTTTSPPSIDGTIVETESEDDEDEAGAGATEEEDHEELVSMMFTFPVPPNRIVRRRNRTVSHDSTFSTPESIAGESFSMPSCRSLSPPLTPPHTPGKFHQNWKIHGQDPDACDSSIEVLYLPQLKDANAWIEEKPAPGRHEARVERWFSAALLQLSEGHFPADQY